MLFTPQVLFINRAWPEAKSLKAHPGPPTQVSASQLHFRVCMSRKLGTGAELVFELRHFEKDVHAPRSTLTPHQILLSFHFFNLKGILLVRHILWQINITKKPKQTWIHLLPWAKSVTPVTILGTLVIEGGLMERNKTTAKYDRNSNSYPLIFHCQMRINVVQISESKPPAVGVVGVNRTICLNILSPSILKWIQWTVDQ